MPLFPRYQSKGRLTTQTPSPMAPEDNSGKIVQGLGEVANKGMDIALKFEDSMKSTRNTVATVDHKSELLDIEQRALSDPDPNNQKMYMSELQKSYQKHSQGLDYVDAKKLALENQVAGIQLDNVFKKKWLEVDSLAVNKFVDQQIANPGPDSFPKIKNILAEKIRTGHMDQTTAYEIEKKANNDLGVARVSNDIFGAQTQEQVSAVKEGLTSGSYEAGGVVIDPKEKLKLLRSIETRGRQITTNDNFANKVARQKDTHELIDLSNNGLLTPGKLEEYFKTERISNSTYTALQEKIDSPVGPTANTDPQTYYDITNALLKDDLEPEKAIERILKANASGKLSPDDAKKIYEMHLIPSDDGFKSLSQSQGGSEFDKMKQGFDAEIQAVKDKRNWFKAAFKTFNEFFSGPDKEKMVAGATQKLLNLVKENKLQDKNIPEAADWVVAQENVKKHPDWAKLPENGKRGRDRYGNKVIVYPDGRVVRSE